MRQSIDAIWMQFIDIYSAKDCKLITDLNTLSQKKKYQKVKFCLIGKQLELI